MTLTKAPKIKSSLFYSGLVIILFIIISMIWMMFAQLESAAIASGSVVVASGRRVIQHFEGGIVKKIFVKEGSTVEKSALLLVLENTQAKAVSQIHQNEFWQLLGTKARISAELGLVNKPRFPDALTNANLPVTNEIIRLQNDLFIANQRAFKGSVNIYKQRIEQLNEQINGKQAEVKANIEQLDYINKELKEVEVLAKKKLVKLSRLLALKREAASLTGKQGELNATIAGLKQKIGETKLEIIAVTEKRHKDLLDELHETQKKLSDVLERQKTSADILERTEIRSPIAGKVMDLKVHTIGGVIKAGEPIMDIVPLHETLIIEAKLNPLDIDVVHKGLVAKVMLTGLSQRNTPTLLGKVTHVSADAIIEPSTNRAYFSVRIEVPGKEFKKLTIQALYPGMPAEVMIITKTATPWEYFTTPVISSFNRAFRED